MSEVASKVPQLRFPEFSGEWKDTNLGKISTNVMYGVGAAATKFDGVNKYLRITDIDESSRKFSPSPLTSPEGFIDDVYRLSSGDVVFARTGASVGKSYLYKPSDGNLIFAGFLIKFNVSGADPYFVYSNTFRSVYDNWVSVMSVRSGQPGINAEEYKLLPISLPSKPEQQKIAAFLTAVDNKIELLGKKQALLKEYKKGLMQQIFSQEIRFSPKGTSSQAQGEIDDGSEFADWEEKKLGDVGKVYQPKTISQTDLTTKGFDVYGANGIIGKYSEYNHEFEQIAVTCRGNTCGTVNFTKPKSWITGNAMVVNVDDSKVVNKTFIYYQLSHTNLTYLITGSGQPQITGDIKTHKVKIPSLPEQTKIANFLSSIDSKIEQVGEQLDKSKQFKKALLQQMFV